MADEQDLKDLHSGDTDMARRDFRNADLSNLNLENRDFSGAHLEGANLSCSNLSGATFTQAHLSNCRMRYTILSEAIISNTSLYSVDFEGANFQNSRCSGSHFAKTNISNSKLEGADFQRCHFNEGTTLEGCSINEKTLFDNANVFRPLSRQPAFFYYRVERGILVRKKNDEIIFSPTPSPPLAHALDERQQLRDQVIIHVDSLLRHMSNLTPPEHTQAVYAGIGHNGPPEETPIERPEFETFKSTLVDVRSAVLSEEPPVEHLKDLRQKNCKHIRKNW